MFTSLSIISEGRLLLDSILNFFLNPLAPYPVLQELFKVCFPFLTCSIALNLLEGARRSESAKFTICLCIAGIVFAILGLFWIN